jgi:hypothetical protein
VVQDGVENLIRFQHTADILRDLAQGFRLFASHALPFKQPRVLHRVDALLCKRLDKCHLLQGEMAGLPMPQHNATGHLLSAQHRHSQNGTDLFYFRLLAKEIARLSPYVGNLNRATLNDGTTDGTLSQQNAVGVERLDEFVADSDCRLDIQTSIGSEGKDPTGVRTRELSGALGNKSQHRLEVRHRRDLLADVGQGCQFAGAASRLFKQLRVLNCYGGLSCQRYEKVDLLWRERVPRARRQLDDPDDCAPGAQWDR